MAGKKNQVTLTFAGDSSKLEESFGRVGASAKSMQDDVGKASKKIAEESGSSFDKVGESFDNTETKALGFKDTLDGVGGTMSGVSQIAKGDLYGGLLTVGQGMADLAGGVANFVVPALKGAVTWIKNTTIAQKALNLAMRLNPIGLVITALVLLAVGIKIAWERSETFRRIVTGAFGAVSSLAQSALGLFRGVVNFIGDNWKRLPLLLLGPVGITLFIFKGLPGKIVKSLGNMLGLLKQKGLEVLQGFWNGLAEKWKKVTEWVGNIAQWIKDHKGPVSLDGTLLIPAGRAIMSGFLTGLQSGAGKAWDFVKSVGGKTVDMLRAVESAAGGVPLSSGMAKLVQRIAASYGWGGGYQWDALTKLIQGESGFRPNAQNPTSSAYGLFQFLDSTWGSVGGHKTSDPTLQTIYGLRYIAQRYGSPAQAFAAWSSRSPHWYAQGTPWVPDDQLAFLHRGEAVVPAAVNARARGGMTGGSQPLIVQLVVDGKVLQQVLLKVKRTNGGLALGLA